MNPENHGAKRQYYKGVTQQCCFCTRSWECDVCSWHRKKHYCLGEECDVCSKRREHADDDDDDFGSAEEAQKTAQWEAEGNGLLTRIIVSMAESERRLEKLEEGALARLDKVDEKLEALYCRYEEGQEKVFTNSLPWTIVICLIITVATITIIVLLA